MKPNIVEIIWHDLGQHLSCYGVSSVKSPHLDLFSTEGTTLENMFCVAPQCSPSRASIMTGCYPHTNGMMGLAHLGWDYNEGQRTLTHILKQYGYRNYLLGYQHEASWISNDYLKTQLGYDFVLDSESCYSRRITPSICTFIENQLDKDNPFFMSIGFSDVHRPNRGEVKKNDIDRVILPSYIPDTYEMRRDIVQFEKMIETADQCVGEILQSIKKAGLEENTIVVFTTDHGPEFNRAKMTLYDAGLKVCCIYKWKNHVKEKQRLKAMRSNIDILPTLLDLADITIPEFVQGESFKWSLLGQEDKSRDYILAEKTYHVKYDPMRCIRTERYKYIWNKKPYEPMQISVEHSVRMGLELASRLYGKERTEDELYDLANDPGEKNNLAYKDDFQEIKKKLKQKLLISLQETNDPVIDRDVPPRKEAEAHSKWVLCRSETGAMNMQLKVTHPGYWQSRAK